MQKSDKSYVEVIRRPCISTNVLTIRVLCSPDFAMVLYFFIILLYSALMRNKLIYTTIY